MGDEAAGTDPFEGWQLDDDFVGGAAHHEGSAKERAQEHRRQVEAQRHAQKSRKKQERKQRRADRRSSYGEGRGASGASNWSNDGTTRNVPWRGIFAVGLVVGFVVWSSLFRDGGSTTYGHSADAMNIQGHITSYPSPSKEQADEPLGRPTAMPVQPGPYVFIGTQSDGSRPVAYDPCRPIHVVVNERTLPIGGDILLEQALADIESLTGLHFIMDGTTDEEPALDRPPVNKDRYGDQWAPVLVAWTDPLVTKDLEGTIAGVGGSQRITKGSGDDIYTTGTVALDGPQFAKIIGRGNGQAVALAIIRHELGHLVGLNHVSDPTQIMYGEATGENNTFGSGDTAGLVQLGKGECRPDL